MTATGATWTAAAPALPDPADDDARAERLSEVLAGSLVRIAREGAAAEPLATKASA